MNALIIILHDVIHGSERNTNGALFYFVEAVCDYIIMTIKEMEPTFFACRRILSTWQSYLYRAEYQTNNKIFGSTQDNNVTRAVCYVANKSTKLVIQ